MSRVSKEHRNFTISLVREKLRNTFRKETVFLNSRPGIFSHCICSKRHVWLHTSHGGDQVTAADQTGTNMTLIASTCCQTSLATSKSGDMDQAQSELLAILHAFTLRHGSEKGKLSHFQSYSSWFQANSPQSGRGSLSIRGGSPNALPT